MWSVWPLRLARGRRASPGPDRAFRQAGWLRPGQAGVIVIGAVRPVHIAATLVDLSGRGYLRIEEADGEDPDWLIMAARLPVTQVPSATIMATTAAMAATSSDGPTCRGRR